MSIDLNFRPTSYSDFDGPVAAALNGIRGQMRREMVRDMLTAEGEQRVFYDNVLGPISEEVLSNTSPQDFVDHANQTMGPSWMGGEYLPRERHGEIEIARVVLASTLMDVFSLRARWSGGRYRYRMVDEYSTKFHLCRKTSMKPLKLSDVIEMLQTGEGVDIDSGPRGLVEPWWNQQRDYGDDPEKCTAFAWVESEIYPELAAWYEEYGEAWRAEYQTDLDITTLLEEVNGGQGEGPA